MPHFHQCPNYLFYIYSNTYFIDRIHIQIKNLLQAICSRTCSHNTCGICSLNLHGYSLHYLTAIDFPLFHSSESTVILSILSFPFLLRPVLRKNTHCLNSRTNELTCLGCSFHVPGIFNDPLMK